VIRRTGLTGYLIRRAINSVLLIFGTIILTFVLTHLIAANPASIWAGPHASKTQVEAIINQYHLNQPVYTQLYYYLADAFTFNFGTSPYFKQPVSSLIATFFPRTLELDFLAITLTIILGVFTGAFAAAHRDRAGDHGVRAFYLITWSMPPFLVALILQYFFAYHWILPPSQLANPGQQLPPQITGFITLDALLSGDWSFFIASIQHLILPVISLALISFGIITRITRSSMLDILRTDYVRTAMMKGVGRRRAVYYHALKNSLIPVITIIALTFSFLIAGSVVIEQIFSYEGIGYLITSALYNYDYPTLIGSTIVITIAVVLINFVADVLYAVVDPRVRFGGAQG
jgi:peptide/nickel transport system permease protein